MTHVNAFKMDVEAALADAKKALGDVEQRVAALVAKLEEDVSTDVAAAEAPAEPAPEAAPEAETPDPDSTKTK